MINKTSIIFLFMCISLFATQQTYIRAYSYQASESDSKLSCRQNALVSVKRLLLEEICTYLISQSNVSKFRLTNDQITSLSAGYLKVQILSENWDGKIYYLRASIEADPDQIITELRRVVENESSSDNMVSNERSSANLIDQYYKEGCKLLSKPNSQIGAIKKFDKVIELDPNHALAYLNRALANLWSHRNEDAISDASSALINDPSLIDAYRIRGCAYVSMCTVDAARDGLDDLQKYFNNGGDDYSACFHSFAGWLTLSNVNQAMYELRQGARNNDIVCKSMLSQIEEGTPPATFKCRQR